MIEKIKRNWKRILLIGAGSYVAIAIISTVVGGMLIKGRMEKMERHEDTIGKAFEERKADFKEKFNKNWNAKRDSLIEGFKSTEKHSDKQVLKGMKGAQEITQQMLSNSGLFRWEGRPESDKIKLKQELKDRAALIAKEESAFKKKWFSQRDDETLEQFERRQDEGGIDWEVEYIAKCEWTMKDTTDEYELEDWKQHLKREKEQLTYLQEEFQSKYGEPYDRTEFQELCVVLQEQARQETQDFLDDIAAKHAAAEQKAELGPMKYARDAVVGSEKEHSVFSEEKSHLILFNLRKQLGLYEKYNGLVAAFEEKWGIEAEGPLREFKAKRDRKWGRGRSDYWGFLPVDYLAKEKELEALLPKIELECDTQFIADLRERILDHEKEIQKLQQGIDREVYMGAHHSMVVYKRNAMEATKTEFKNLKIDASILSLEEAFEKKWSPKREEETIEQFERRLSEGNIQFLAAFIERSNIDRGNSYPAHDVLSQAKESFFEKYGEVCPEGQRKEFLPLEIARDAVIRGENQRWRSPEKSYQGLKQLHTLLDLYAQYNGLVAAFEEKWGIEAEGPLREFKAKMDQEWGREKVVDWGFLPVDYLAKQQELKELLPKVELEFDIYFIADLREKISDHENEFQKRKEELEQGIKKEGGFFGSRHKLFMLKSEYEENEKRFESRRWRPSLLCLEEAFEKKWAPQAKGETIEQFERRQDEGNIQFLAAFIERSNIDRGNSYPAHDVLSQAKESFFEKYGEVCPEANLVNVATN